MTEMIGTLAQLAGIGETLLWTGFVVLLRVGAAMALLPAFGELVVPQRIRLVLALAFTAIISPAVAADIPPMDQGPSRSRPSAIC